MLGGAVGGVEEKLNHIIDTQLHEYDVFIDAEEGATPKPGAAADPCGAPRNAGVQGGTESSNLLCSSGESLAKLTPLPGATRTDPAQDLRRSARRIHAGERRGPVSV